MSDCKEFTYERKYAGRKGTTYLSLSYTADEKLRIEMLKFLPVFRHTICKEYILSSVGV